MAREKYQTLTEQMFYILICLTHENCGVDIMKRVEELTTGRVIIGPGTLYSLLDNFVKEKIIIETKIENRKKSYVITKLGTEMLEKEYERLNKLKEDYEILVKGGGSNEGYN
ncbi:PadR family transcriptional regulator [Sedimentibacter hydroxybenzoicus DSM 7310]|uniref:PadR family transcriptional regulator n=1 Tax=Sedimentibacter hydroxybenzoicus DSM 7310 TaxID=1123245 RepID=A0A974BM51_SEDHY|nr:PadR family transcriptional regulator [Sedimentibacter hydroxybenzoicus]NYB75110.1 PadR family transcriptional regulator [Sedimentibacter hydroxybenzoicus DSM 7310]